MARVGLVAMESLYHFTPQSSRTNSMRCLPRRRCGPPGRSLPGRHYSPHGADGRQIVFHVVQAGDADLPHGQRGFPPPVYHGEGAVLPQKGPLFRLFTSRVKKKVSPLVSSPKEAVISLSKFDAVRENPVWWAKMFFLASMYSAISLWTSRWLGATLVTTATLGLDRMEISWKLGELHHRPVIGGDLFQDGQQRPADVAPFVDGEALLLQHFSDEGSGGGLAVGTSSPFTGQGHSSRKTSSSLVTTWPRRRAAVSWGVRYFIPGERKMISPSSHRG